MNISFESSEPKQDVTEKIREELGALALSISSEDTSRPWGAFFVIDHASEEKFIDDYFSDVSKEEIYKYGTNISPKILLVAPGQELSWQYHHRRAELWKVVKGPIGVVQSSDDEVTATKTYNDGQLIKHDTEVRHRLVGKDNWGIVAEIWQHTDPSQPSDEDDIVRLQDNYGRN